MALLGSGLTEVWRRLCHLEEVTKEPGGDRSLACITEQTRVLRCIWRGGPCAFPRGLQSGVLPRVCCQASLVGRGGPGAWIRVACSSEGNAVEHHLDRISGGIKVLPPEDKKLSHVTDGAATWPPAMSEESELLATGCESHFCLLAARET